MPYYTPPLTAPVTHPLESSYGHPVPVGLNPLIIYRDDGTIKGVDYYASGAKVDNPALLDQGIYDLTLRQYYHAWRRLSRLAFLVCGPSTTQALNGVTSFIDLHFNHVFSYAATGDGTGIVITWSAEENHPNNTGLTYGVTVFDGWDLANTDVHATANVAQVTGIVIGEGTATLTLTKALNTGRENKLYASIESDPPDWPIIRLTAETGGPWRPEPDHLTRFFLGRGLYRIEGEYANQYKIGRDDAESIGYMLGWPGTRWVNDGLTIYEGSGEAAIVVSYPHKNYIGQGILRHRTGISTDGIETFENFEQAQARLGALMTDYQGVLKSIVDGMESSEDGRPAKKSPSGTGELIDSDDPAKYAEIAFGMRRIGVQLVGGTSAISGAGEDEVQRARPRTYISREFNPSMPESDTEGESRITVYATTQTIAGVNTAENEVEVTWKLPGYCDTLDAPRATHEKAVTGAIAAITWTGNEAEIEFNLADVYYVYRDGIDNTQDTFESGGNCVCPDLHLEPTNPISLSAIGDRQEKIAPGDVIRFGAGTGAAIVTAAEAFGGTEVSGADAPVSGAPGISDALRATHKKRDIITVEIVGPSGAAFAAEAVVSATIASVKHEAVSYPHDSPAVSYWNPSTEAWTGLTYGDTVAFDCISGIIYVAPGPLPLAETRLMAVGEFFDRRRVYPCEVANVLHGAIDGACAGYADHAASAAAAHLEIRLNLPQHSMSGYHPVEWVTPSAIDHPEIDYPTEDSADDIPLVFPYLPLSPYTRDDYEHKWIYDTSGDGVQGVLMVDSPQYMVAYNDIIGVQVPIPQRWTSAEIETAVCDVFFGEPVQYEQRIQFYPEPDEGDSYYDVVDDPLANCKLAGFVVAYEWNGDLSAYEVTSVRAAGLTLALGSLAEVDGGVQGTVDVTGIMKALADMTFAENELAFVGVIGPMATEPLSTARELLNSWIYEYVFVPGVIPETPDVWAATVGRILFSSISMTNWRIRPSAGNITGARYVEVE